MNRLIITLSKNGKRDTMKPIPINEDFQMETTTSFSNFETLAPTISSIVDAANMYTGLSGNISRTGLDLRTILDAPRWQRTEPLKVTLDAWFYTRTNPATDVIDPLHTLIGLHILKRDGGQIKIPGLNATNVKSLSESLEGLSDEEKKTYEELVKEQGGEEKVKKLAETTYDSTFSVLIPGVVHIPIAILFAIQPTFSKHVTKKGYPLWVSVNMQIQSLGPAMFDFLKNGVDFRDQKTADIIKKETATVQPRN